MDVSVGFVLRGQVKPVVLAVQIAEGLLRHAAPKPSAEERMSGASSLPAWSAGRVSGTMLGPLSGGLAVPPEHPSPCRLRTPIIRKRLLSRMIAPVRLIRVISSNECRSRLPIAGISAAISSTRGPFSRTPRSGWYQKALPLQRSLRGLSRAKQVRARTNAVPVWTLPLTSKICGALRMGDRKQKRGFVARRAGPECQAQVEMSGIWIARACRWM